MPVRCAIRSFQVFLFFPTEDDSETLRKGTDLFDSFEMQPQCVNVSMSEGVALMFEFTADLCMVLDSLLPRIWKWTGSLSFQLQGGTSESAGLRAEIQRLMDETGRRSWACM